jgi:hypothetical protein
MTKKIILAAILLCTLIPFAAQATVTRVIGLGGENANYIIKDAYNPTIWPQLVLDWPNLAGAEFYTPGDNYFEKAYVNYKFSEDNGVLQFSLDRNSGLRSQFGLGAIGAVGTYTYTEAPVPTDPTGTPINNPASKFSAIYGRRFGDLKAGLQLVMAERSSTYKSGTNTDKTNNMLIGFNLGLSALEDKLDMSLGYDMVSFKQEAGGATTVENDGSMALNLAARYWYDVNTKYALIPNFRFLTLKDAWKATNTGEAYTYTDIKLGVGNNWTPVEDMLAIFELGIDLRSKKLEDKTVTPSVTVKDNGNYFPYWRVGFESVVFPWLKGRLGAERGWIAETSDAKPAEPEASYSATYTYLGATAHWNRLYLDLLVAPDFIQNGPDFVSGAATAPLFSRVSLKYNFNQ